MNNELPVLVQSAVATITAPDKRTNTYTLFDDGEHRDGKAGDGIFGATVIWELPGSYLASVASQTATAQGTVKLHGTRGYYNKEGSDSDADGLPDDWEADFSPACGPLLHPRADIDGDGLDNAAEWSFGSDPTKADTDGDGKDDAREYRDGTNPAVPGR